eukprot:90754-Alexandrium_andersonii.AAC.1
MQQCDAVHSSLKVEAGCSSNCNSSGAHAARTERDGTAMKAKDYELDMKAEQKSLSLIHI